MYASSKKNKLLDLFQNWISSPQVVMLNFFQHLKEIPNNPCFRGDGVRDDGFVEIEGRFDRTLLIISIHKTSGK